LYFLYPHNRHNVIVPAVGRVCHHTI
jgi:hypothetical protein